MSFPHVAVDAATDAHTLTVNPKPGTTDRVWFTTTCGRTVELDRLAVAGLVSDLALWLGGEQE